MPTVKQTVNQRAFSKFVKNPPLLVAQQENLTHNDRIETLTIRTLTGGAKGKRKPELDVAGSLVTAKVTLTIEGASTLTLGIHDPKWKIERSGLLDRDANGRLDSIAMSLDRLRFRLVKAARNDDATLELTFEDEVWALLRAHRSHISSSRNALTRAQFIERMVREVKLRDLVYYAPEKGKKQPTAHPDFPDLTSNATDTTKKRTYDEKHWAAALLASLSIEQSKANMQGIIGWERAEGGHWNNDAKFNPLNTTQTMPGATSINSVGVKAYRSWQQGFQATIKTLHNGHYAGILSALKGDSPSAIANAIDASPWGTATGLIQRAVAGAPSNLHGVDGGASTTDGGESTHEAVRVKSYRFTRGLPGQAENTVQCATRLADEVAWRLYAVGAVVYFVSDYFLVAQPADFVFDGFDADGLLSRPRYEWDHRKLTAECELDVAANAWGVLPGSCVDLDNMGPVDGRWIVRDFEFDLFNADVATVTLTKPTRPKKEPAPELFVVNVGDGTASSEVDAGTPGSGSAKKAVAWAQSRIGHYAEEFGQNRGTELDQLERKFGFTGAPWCAIFATTALVMGGVPRSCRTAAVAQINQWATEGSHGYQKGSRATAKPGDLITFGNDHVGFVEKVSGSSLHTIEGNTSANKVARLTRAASSGRIVRPKYPED